ncbi:hypothetical protein [Mycobacteroides abscessus]|uniref:hypothetical protein n=1 Tax=Mycobacteroides abscessus TaxID=36809 RepID=UPI001877B889|nr:hypothetical protein [Mycobacteroides abscessus]
MARLHVNKLTAGQTVCTVMRLGQGVDGSPTEYASSAAMASRYQRQPPQQVLQNAKSGEDK